MSRIAGHLAVDGAELAMDRWPGAGPLVVLLHAGVCDRRSWYETADHLDGVADVVAYDRRGYGETPPSSTEFRHLDDLFAVLDEVTERPAWLVGSSAGGGIALDAAVSRPDRVAGLVLLAPAVSGSPEIVDELLDAETLRLGELLEAAQSAGRVDELARLHARLWLDGPNAPEGRIAGPARDLALDMAGIVMRNGVPESAGASDLDAWANLEQVDAPTTLACGDLDVPLFLERCGEMAERMPNARLRLLPGMAHLPYLEDPRLVADVIREAVPTG